MSHIAHCTVYMQDLKKNSIIFFTFKSIEKIEYAYDEYHIEYLVIRDFTSTSIAVLKLGRFIYLNNYTINSDLL